MRRVIKATEPQEFTEWKAKENAEWQPSYAALQNPEKRALHDALLAEQGWTCCYCGRLIAREASHIEHFRPQESRADLALEYANLHASCIRETGPGAPLHCGHAKGSDYDDEKAISPLEDGCEQRFIYSSKDGAIFSADKADEAAKYMVGLLRLDLAFLNDRRAEALKSAFDDDFVRSATDDELVKLAQAYRVPDGTGRMTSFGHVLSRYAEQLLGARVL